MDPYYYAPAAAAEGAYLPPSPLSPEQHTHHQPFLAGGRGLTATSSSTISSSSSPESDKARIGELAFLKSTLLSDGFFLPADWEESVLGLIAGGLRCGRPCVPLVWLDRLYHASTHHITMPSF